MSIIIIVVVGDSSGLLQASKDEPRYLIRNDNTQKETAYKEDNIMGKAE